MEEAYRDTDGVPGTVFYPTRAADLLVAREPPARLSREIKNLTVAFAGTLHPGQIAPMRTMVKVLRVLNGRLLIYGPMTQEELDREGLSGPQVEYRGMLLPNDLIAAVRGEADLLYAPISFEEQWRGNSSMGFPSKLTDYSAAAVPMLIHGPSWASAVQWASQELGGALVLQDTAAGSLGGVLLQFQRDPQFRRRLAQGAAVAGHKYFSAKAAAAIFCSVLCKAGTPVLPS
jgi:hypothetical protein